MPAPDAILALIDRFRANLDSYKRGYYNETQVRREFIDPFFEALGWDVANRQGYAEAYKDVVHEDAIKVSGGTQAPHPHHRLHRPRRRRRHDRMVSLVERTVAGVDLYKWLAAEQTPHVKTALQRHAGGGRPGV